MSDEINQPAIEEGSTVWLKSGGPAMTVEAIDGDNVLASWVDEADAEQSAEFSVDTLTLTNPSVEQTVEENTDEQRIASDNSGVHEEPAASDSGADSAAEGEEVQTQEEAPVSQEPADEEQSGIEGAGDGGDGVGSAGNTDDSGAGDSAPQEVDTAAIQVGIAQVVAAEPAEPAAPTEEPAEAAAQEPVAEADEVDAPVPEGGIFGDKDTSNRVTVHLHSDASPEAVGVSFVDTELVQVQTDEGKLETIDAFDLQVGQNLVLGQDCVVRILSLTYDWVDQAKTGDEEFSSSTEETNIAEQFETEPVEEAPLDLAERDLRAELDGVLPPDALAAWPKDALILYKEKGVWVEKTKRGNWVEDIRRNNATLQWSANALLDWAEGKIATPVGVDEDLLWEELYTRFKIPGNYGHEDAAKFAIDGTLPDTTASGLLVNDAIRTIKHIAHWTYAELRGALLGEIETEHSEEELLTQLRRRLGVNDTFGAERLKQQLVDASAEANVNDTLLRSTLDEYATTMTRYGANLTEASAGKAQDTLNNAIRNVMKRDYPAFHEGWNIILDFVNTRYTQLFTPDKARRGWSNLGVTGKARATFEDLLTLIIATRSPATRRQQAEVYKVDNVLRYVTNEQERQNVLTYYSTFGQ